MEAATYDLAPYLKLMSPPKSTTALLQEIHYNTAATQSLYSSIESDEFCTKQNIEECLQYLDKEFQVLGLQSLYNGNGNFDVYRLVNVTQKLLRKCQQSSRYREELETRIHRCSADLEHSQNTQRKMRQTNKNLQNSIGKCEEVERQVRIENSSLQIKLKSQYDEVKRLKSLIQSNENQYRHETKKQERQLQLMKERAQQVMTDRSRQVPSIEISQCLSQRDGKRSRWRNESSSNRHEEDMYNTVMGNFEKRCTVLQSENRRLRDVLADIQIEMYELSNSAIPGGTSPRKTHSPRANKDLVQLPVDMIQQRLIESLRNTSERIRTKIDNNNEPDDMNVTFTLEPHPQTIEEKELSPQYKTQEADKSIDVSLLEEQENLSKEKTQFYKQKVKLEQEKQNLAEAVLNLQKERLKFEEMRVESMSSPVNGANNKQSPRNHLTVSPKNHSTVSPRNHSTASPRNHSTASPRNNSTLSPRPKSGLSTYRSPGRCNDDRISEHMEQVKLAVQDRERDGKSPH